MMAMISFMSLPLDLLCAAATNAAGRSRQAQSRIVPNCAGLRCLQRPAQESPAVQAFACTYW
jgi:hypothetical protein